MRPRELKINDMISNIARLRALRAFAEDNSDFSDSERRELDKNICVSRRIIIDQLKPSELLALKEKNLQPEDALQVLRDDSRPAILDKATHAVLMKQYREDVARQQFFVVEKAYVPPQLGAPMADYDRNGKIERFKLPSISKPVTASLADVHHNHTRKEMP